MIDGREAIWLVERIWAIGEEERYTSVRGRLAANAMLVAAASRRVRVASSHRKCPAVDWAGLPLATEECSPAGQ